MAAETTQAPESAFHVMEQFMLSPVIGPLGFASSNVWMLIAGALVTGLMVIGMQPRAMVPGRLQSVAEAAYEFVYGLIDEQVGHEGRKFFPFVFTLFMFILFGNLLGMLPYGYTFTSHIMVTLTLAAIVFILTTAVAIMIHGRHFLSYFAPEGVSPVLLVLVVPIEIISYLSRLVSLSVRLFANMMAGHVMLKVFATFIVLLGGAGVIGAIGGVVPLALNIALVGFEFLVAFLQAYVFAILTCIYLHDAIHLH
jgi:F-type H+-transporting ATPase subunit a